MPYAYLIHTLTYICNTSYSIIFLSYIFNMIHGLFVQVKCEEYWPVVEGGTKTFADITVTLTKSDEWPNYTIRKLTVKKVCQFKIVLQEVQIKKCRHLNHRHTIYFYA